MEVAALGLRVDGADGIERARDSLAGLSRASTDAEKAAGGVSKAADRAKDSIGAAGKSAAGASASFSSMAAMALRAGAVLGAAFSVNALRGYADAWSDMQSQVGAATGDMAGAAASMQRLTEMANASYSPLQQTVDVYARNVATFRDLGRSASEAADFTEAVNHALVTTATRGQDADVVIGSLSRSLATGKLDAQAFDTIVSRSPRVLKAMADEMGVTTSALRQMAVDGKVTSNVIATGLVSSLEELRKEAALMPATLADAFVRVNNNLTEFVGRADKASGASASMAEAIIGIAEGIRSISNSEAVLSAIARGASVLGDAFKWLGVTAGVVLVARLASATAAFAVNTAAATLNQIAMARAASGSLAAAAANAALATSARAASAAMSLLGGPIGIVVGLLSAAALAFFDFSNGANRAQEETALLAEEVKNMSRLQAEATRFKLVEKLEEVEKRAEEAAQMLRSTTSDYEELKRAFEQGRGVDAKGLANVEQAVRETKLELANATEQAEKFRQKIADVDAQLKSLDGAGPVKAASDEMASKLQKWLAMYATQSEKLEAKLAEARADFGGVIPKEVEDRIRSAYAVRSSGGGAKQQESELANLVKQLQSQQATLGMTAEQAERYRIVTAAGTEADRARALALFDQVHAWNETEKAMQAAIDSSRQYMAFEQELQVFQQRMDLEAAGVGMGDRQREMAQQALAIRQEYAQKRLELEQAQQVAATALDQAQYEERLALYQQFEDAKLAKAQEAAEARAAAEADWTNGMARAWENFAVQTQNMAAQTEALFANMLNTMTTGFGNAFESMVFDSENLGDAMQKLGQNMLRSVVNALGQMAAQWLAYQAVQLLVGKTTQAVGASALTANAYATALQAGISAFASTAAIPIVGPAAAPAAMAAALSVTMPMAAAVSGVALAGMAHDGIDSVPQTGTWLLEKGERVTTAKTSARLDSVLERIDARQRGALTSAQASASQPSKGVTVNVIENPDRAGQTETRRNEYGDEEADVFVADIFGDGKRSQALRQAFGLQRVGR
ncbi:tape measure protein [Alcaligenes sp. WGS1538]|uniref:tape measure protein n=1 Tax=Alcaligenes sp. WGS1538 TaxID=3366811 RepID=UPI00372D2FFB